MSATDITSKRRSFRPSTFRPLSNTSSASLDALTDSLRASLMHVGMRVRKSVPEGYKTAPKSTTSFSIYEQTAAAHPELQSFAGHKVLPLQSGSPPSSMGPGGTEEGMGTMSDVQIAETIDDVLSGIETDLAGWGDSSQESSFSAGSSVGWPGGSQGSVRSAMRRSARRKRILDDEEDEGEVDVFGRRVGGIPIERDAPLRPIAQPRSRRPEVRRMASDRSEKSVRFARLEPVDDFEEADFLMRDHSWNE